MNNYAVVVTYAYLDDCEIYLFDSVNEACNYLKKLILDKYKFETDQNGCTATYTIEEDECFGAVEYHSSRNQEKSYDIMWAQIGNVHKSEAL